MDRAKVKGEAGRESARARSEKADDDRGRTRLVRGWRLRVSRVIPSWKPCVGSLDEDS